MAVLLGLGDSRRSMHVAGFRASFCFLTKKLMNSIMTLAYRKSFMMSFRDSYV